MYRTRAKRVLDLLGATIAVALLAPIWPIAALITLVSSGRPILFKQQRLGYEGRVFTLFKFRTMSEVRDPTGELLPDEQRITKTGRWMRSLSLDELPELFNVIRGDMSLVGPRPLLPEYKDLYSAEQWRRHEVHPGLVGPVTAYGRNDLAWDEKFDLDRWYVDNLSFTLDVKLAARSVWRALRREGVNAPGHATMPRFEGRRDE